MHYGKRIIAGVLFLVAAAVLLGLGFLGAIAGPQGNFLGWLFSMGLLGLLMLAATFCAWERLSRIWSPEEKKENGCPKCNYDLTGNVSQVCPECGLPVPPQVPYYPPPTHLRLNEHAAGVLESAHVQAHRLKCDYLGTDHILLALLIGESRDCAFSADLLGPARETVLSKLQSRPPGSYSEPARVLLPFTPKAMAALLRARVEADQANDIVIDVHHLWLALLSDEESEAMQILTACGIDPGHIREMILHAVSGDAAGS